MSYFPGPDSRWTFFTPRAVAVVGATEAPGSVGRTILGNLVASPFSGTVFPVNPKRPSVLGLKAYPTLADVPAKVDLAVIVTPAAAGPGIVGQCADLGVPAAVIVSAGFREVGAAGAELERRTLAEARRGRVRLVGPNCLGVMSPVSGLNATFAAGMARPGSVAFLSQSGALLTAILDWSLKVQLGLAGRTEAAARAAASHTGALTASDEVLDAAFRRVGPPSWSARSPGWRRSCKTLPHETKDHRAVRLQRYSRARAGVGG